MIGRILKVVVISLAIVHGPIDLSAQSTAPAADFRHLIGDWEGWAQGTTGGGVRTYLTIKQVSGEEISGTLTSQVALVTTIVTCRSPARLSVTHSQRLSRYRVLRR